MGQTPPPFGGQAVAIASFVSGHYRNLEIFHVRMAFSRQTSDIGKPRFGKVLHLIGLVMRILWRRARTGARVLYYPPAGPDVVPVLRDLAILCCTRWAFPMTVFHLHASGISTIEQRLPRPLQVFFRRAYGNPDLVIQTSALNPPDGRRLRARRVAVIPNGIPDHPLAQGGPHEPSDEPPVLLYGGVLCESKGLLVLVEACRRLRDEQLDFRLELMGAFESTRFEHRLRAAVDAAGLTQRTVYLGVRTGDEKVKCFCRSDVFCYPTYFDAESFGIVLVEAMRSWLPVVATRWRGVPSVVAEGESGLLVSVRDPLALHDALATLIQDRDLRCRMGRRGRELYLERFTEERYRADMEAVLGQLRHR